jgi:uracil-DNA glycosylase family 4
MDSRSLKELELLELAGLYGFAQAPAVARPASVAQPASPAPMAREPQAAPPPAPPADTAPITLPADWDGLRAMVRDCTRCGLCRQRKQAVFGVGAERGPWLFVGEGPGAEEDEQGEPFVGQSGKLLDNMLAAIGLKRGREAYIANVVKCRPPGNRTPTLEEAAACAPYLDAQVDLIRPGLIVALGKVAAQRLLGAEASLASLRGKVHQYRGYPVVVTYHPSYLLRTLPEKAKAWEDLLFARSKMLEFAATRPHDRGAP